MAAFANVNGQGTVSLNLAIPLYGLWVADVALALGTAIATGPVTLTLGNMTLTGAVYRQNVFAGQVKARIVGGAGGWNQKVEARGYNNPSGVLLSMVVGDAASEVGESVSIAQDQVIGNFYARFADKASRVLAAVGGPSWWVDSSGVTHIGPRPTPTIMSAFVVEDYRPNTGELVISTEDYASWQPGASFTSATTGTQTVASVRHEMHEKATMKILAA
jgi:hypothetical protein